ncbi:hypothetical protein MMC08_000273 [Hypocenomyce scalaris]|nr:hypothetical protein [Hypocenomyce scalaris]
MPAASYFSFPLTQAPSSTLRASLYKPSRKRKRDEADVGPTSGGSDTDQVLSETAQSPLPSAYHPSSASRSSAPSEAAFTRDVVRQYRTAGQSFDEALPAGHFPHTPLQSKVDTAAELDTRARIHEHLATLKPPLYIPKDAGLSNNLGLRQRHVAVVTSIMHRSLLEGNYIRAGRAWGMLLRAEMDGRHMDLRTHGRWGIGAEVLMRGGDAQPAQRRSRGEDGGGLTGDHDEDSDLHSQERPTHLFSKEGFEKARDYYERLILQYPHRKQQPNAVNALDFYPAMFGLWIYFVQEQRKIALSGTHTSSGNNALEPTNEDLDTNTPPSSPSSERSERGHAPSEEIRRSTLQQAEEIAIRLEELLLSPPYSDDPTLWRLRGMLALWIGDLSVPAPPESNISNGDDPESGESSADDGLDGDEIGMERLLARHEHERSLARKAEHVEKARTAFRHVVRRGGELPEGVKHLIRQDELTSVGSDVPGFGI